MNRKTKLIDIVNFGLDHIGENTSIVELKKYFKEDYRVFVDNGIASLADHIYPGQNHFCLVCEQDVYQVLIDFDLMPIKNTIISIPDNEYVANFKVQILAKSHKLLKFLKAPLWHIYRNVYTFLYERYPQDSIFNNAEIKVALNNCSNQVIGAYKELSPQPKEILLRYFIKDDMYYLATFYRFDGNDSIPAYLSFAVSKI